MRYILAVTAVGLMLLAGCDEPGTYSAVGEESRVEIRAYAGVLARYWALPEDDARHPGPLSETYIEDLAELCDRAPESWAYLYDCVVDSIALLEPPEPECQR